MIVEGWPRRAGCAIGSGLAFMVLLALVGFVFTAVAFATKLVLGADVT
jgi:hypothetical protein